MQLFWSLNISKFSQLPLDAEGVTLAGIVPDHESRDRDVVLVGRTIYLGKPWGVGNLEWGGIEEGGPVHEQPGTKVDGIASRQRRDSK